MFEHYGSDQLVTLLYLVADPCTDQLIIGNAGHPPAVLLRADGIPVPMPPADGPPLGVGRQERVPTTVPFEVGDSLIAFTDGLVERRSEDITDGLDRLAGAVADLRGTALVEAIPTLIERVGDLSRDDDIAVLAARRLS